MEKIYYPNSLKIFLKMNVPFPDSYKIMENIFFRKIGNDDMFKDLGLIVKNWVRFDDVFFMFEVSSKYGDEQKIKNGLSDEDFLILILENLKKDCIKRGGIKKWEELKIYITLKIN